MPRKSSRARARSRRLGVLGLLLSAALTPAGIMVGTVAAGALVGGLAFHLERAAPAVPSTPTQSVPAQAYSPQRLIMEHDGKVLSLVLSEDRLAGAVGTGAFDPPGPLPGGPGGNGSAPHAVPGGMPPHASPGAPASGGKPSLAGPTPVLPFLAGPNGAPPGVRPSHAGSPPTGAPPGPAGPPRLPASNGAPTQPPGEAGAPASPHETPQPPHGAPEGTSPTSHPDAPPVELTPPHTGEPFSPLNSLDPLAPPPGQKLAAQPAAVPEPSMPGLMLLGLAAMAWAVRRRRCPCPAFD
jgi:hypothetical protein